jgi:hypothetical protein
MMTIEGKVVFTELAELVDPAHTALILKAASNPRRVMRCSWCDNAGALRERA